MFSNSCYTVCGEKLRKGTCFASVAATRTKLWNGGGPILAVIGPNFPYFEMVPEVCLTSFVTHCIYDVNGINSLAYKILNGCGCNFDKRMSFHKYLDSSSQIFIRRTCEYKFQLCFWVRHLICVACRFAALIFLNRMVLVLKLNFVC